MVGALTPRTVASLILVISLGMTAVSIAAAAPASAVTVTENATPAANGHAHDMAPIEGDSPPPIDVADERIPDNTFLNNTPA